METAISNMAINPLSDGAQTSEHDKVTKASDTSNYAMGIGAVGMFATMLKSVDLPPMISISIVICCALLFAVGFIAKIWLARQYSKDRTSLKIASLAQPAATITGIVKVLLMLLLPAMLTGCATDQRVVAARDAAAKYEDTCITQHMSVHATEQQSLYNAQAADIAYKTNINVSSAVAAAKANPAIGPDKLAADISRSYQEQQILLNQVSANISNLQTQIAGINAYHIAAQQIFAAEDQYDAVPSVTATGVATAATTALSVAIKPKTANATIATPTVSGTVALPVPGQ